MIINIKILNIIAAVLCIIGVIKASTFLDKRHHVNKSTDRHNDLSCYECNTMNTGEKCSNLSTGNPLEFQQKCTGNGTICRVKRYSYTTSTQNSTSGLRMWYLERSCTDNCQDGCIIIGERTKLYACTSCCFTTYCNVGNYTNRLVIPTYLLIFFVNLAFKEHLKQFLLNT